jgi:iron complex outermembrane receptor protein
MNLSILAIAVTAFFDAFTGGVALAAPLSEEEELAQSYGDKSTISIATGSPLALRSSPSVASVITAEDIKAIGATDLDQVLETVPGIHASKFANHNISSYQIRGITGNAINPQVLLLQNGIPMNTLYRGDKGEIWGSQPLDNVARIEIIRGPNSALYGADAFSGVINIITKKAADTPGTEFGMRGGSFNSKNGWAQHGSKWGELDVAAYLNVGSTDGFKETVNADAATRLDNIFHNHASIAPGSVNTGYDAVDANLDLGYGKHRLRAGYKLRDNVGTGFGASSALDPIGTEKSERISADLSWNDAEFAKNWGLGYTASFLHYTDQSTDLNLYPPGTQFPSGLFPNGMIGFPARWEDQFRVSGYVTYAGFSGHSLRFGLGFDDLNMYKTRTIKNFLLNAAGTPVPTGPIIDYSGIQPHMAPHDRIVKYFYAQDEWSIARDWTLTAGVRHDIYSDFGGTTNPRVALVWDATPDLTAKLLYGQAFRAASFLELYGINPSSNGNPNLKPETIQTMEAAFTWRARLDTQVNLSVFHYDMKDMILTKLNTAPAVGGMFQNTGSVQGNGLELEAIWDATRTVRLTGNYSFQEAIDQTTHQDAGYAPHHHLYLRGDWRFTEDWLASSQVNRVMDRMRVAGDRRPQVPDYTTVDLTIHTNFDKKQWGLTGSVHNLFNASVFEPSINGSLIPYDLPMAPRSIWLQLSYKL